MGGFHGVRKEKIRYRGTIANSRKELDSTWGRVILSREREQMSKKRKKPLTKIKRSKKYLTPISKGVKRKSRKFLRDKKGRFKRVVVHHKKRNKKGRFKRVVHGKTRKKKFQSKKLIHRKPKKRTLHQKRKKLSKRYKGAKKEQIGFLVEHNVPHEAYVLDHTLHFVDGEPVIGINSETLKNITNDFRKQFNRGIQFARLLIEYRVGRGRGKKQITNKWVSTPRMQLADDDSYQDILSAFLSLSIPLYDYDANYFGQERGTNIKIYIEKVHIELFNLELEESINI